MSTALDKSENAEDKRSKFEAFEDILPYIGSTGRYQKFLFIVLLPFFSASAFLYYSHIFTTLVPEEHWCRVPEFDNTNLTDWQKIQLSIPSNSKEGSSNGIHVPYSQCKMYKMNYTEITQGEPGLNTPVVDCQHGWSFNQTSVPYLSIAAELEWVCDKAYLSSTAQTVFFLGNIFGALIFSYIADHYGRVPALIACSSVGFFASIGAAFTNSFWTFIIARFIVGTAYDNTYNIIFIIVIEYVEPKYRTLVTNVCFGIYFAAGSIIYPWIAYWVSDWRILSVATTLPLTVAFIAPWVIPESARWYVQKGRVDEAIEVLKKFAKVNKKDVGSEIYEEFRINCNKLLKNDKFNSNYTVLDLFKLPRLRRITIVLVACWLLINMIYISHIWNMQLLHSDIFVSYSLGAISEFLAACILALFLDRWGRRWMGFFSMFAGGVFSFLVLAMPVGTPAMWVAILARLGTNVAIDMNYQYAAEILPTVVRAQGISLVHIFGFVASSLGPYVVELATFHASLPFIVVGILSFVTAVLMLTQPETLNQELPESLEEGNDFGREQSFWWFPCIDSSPAEKKEYRKNSFAANPSLCFNNFDRSIESTHM